MLTREDLQAISGLLVPLETCIGGLETKFDKFEGRVGRLEDCFDKFEQRFKTLSAKLEIVLRILKLIFRA